MKNLIHKLLLYKEYCGESISDIEEDVYTAINDNGIPIDKDGFIQGEFQLTLKWNRDDDNNRNVDNSNTDNGC